MKKYLFIESIRLWQSLNLPLASCESKMGGNKKDDILCMFIADTKQQKLTGLPRKVASQYTNYSIFGTQSEQ
jgi:hypothetical protein